MWGWSLLRQLRRSWLRRAMRFMRWSRVVAYLCITVAGLAAVFRSPASIEQATGDGHTVQVVWAVLMATSALFCAYGAAADRWVGEYIGLIPLASVAAAFGVAALSRGQVGWAGGFFLFGFFWLLVSRWQEVALLRIEADRQATTRRTNGAGENRGGDSTAPPDTGGRPA